MPRAKVLNEEIEKINEGTEEVPELPEEEVPKLYKFKSLYKTLICYITGAEFKNNMYQTTDEKIAEALRKIKGVTEVTEEE